MFEQLGEPPARDRGRAHLLHQLVVERRRLGRAAAVEDPDLREERHVGLAPLRLEVREVERGARAGARDVVLGEERDRGHGRVDLDEQQPRRVLHHVERPEQAADVRDREHDRDVVVGRDLHRFLHRRVRGRERRVGVARALRVGDGARRVHHPAHGVAVVARRWAEGRGVTVGKIGIGDEHPGVEAVGRALRHRFVVEVAERARDHEQLGLRLAGHEPDFALAVDREDRVLHRTEARERGGEHERLHARGEDPRDRCSFGDSERREARGGALGPVLVLGVRERAALHVDEHLDVRRERGAFLDELPQALPRGVDPVEHCFLLDRGSLFGPAHFLRAGRTQASAASAARGFSTCLSTLPIDVSGNASTGITTSGAL